MARIVITEPADADSAEIIRDLTAKAGELVADRYEAYFGALYLRLERFPGSGSPRPALGQLVRMGIVSPYNIIYEYIEADDTVTIMRIVHGRRRITRRILKRPTTSP
jgi:toxin ParE1/3/4